jgi:hypothetical protein
MSLSFDETLRCRRDSRRGTSGHVIGDDRADRGRSGLVRRGAM